MVNENDYHLDLAGLLQPAYMPLGTDELLNEILDPQPDPYVSDPVGWVSEVLNEALWSKQEEIALSVKDNRYTAVQSCHGTGKSYIASRIVAWWLSTHPVGQAFAVTTAPTQRQVEAILWRYIRQAHGAGKLPGRTTLNSQWYMGADQLVAYGSKPKDYANTEEAMQGFQGIHARYVLVILDEAGGIPKWLWSAVDTLVTNSESRVLAIGNPDDPTSQFEQVCRPGSGWHRIKIGYRDTPDYTGEKVSAKISNELIDRMWIEERKQRWGEKSNLYISKVTGEFPQTAEDVLISPDLVRAAQQRDIEPVGDITYGLDVARSGEDETACYSVQGGVVRKEFRDSGGGDTMETVGRAIRLLHKKPPGTSMRVDVIGVGSGVYDRLREQGQPVTAFNSAQRSRWPKKFKNRRAAAYWNVRVMAENGLLDLDPEDEELAGQLSSIKWKTDSSGRIQIESKEDMRKRGISSPDLADAAVMALEPGTMEQIKQPTSTVRSITGDLLNKPM